MWWKTVLVQSDYLEHLKPFVHTLILQSLRHNSSSGLVESIGGDASLCAEDWVNFPASALMSYRVQTFINQIIYGMFLPGCFLWINSSGLHWACSNCCIGIVSLMRVNGRQQFKSPSSLLSSFLTPCSPPSISFSLLSSLTPLPPTLSLSVHH